MSAGYVYILTNAAMPGYVKIGRTTGEPNARAAQLFSTGVPLPFCVAASFASPDCVWLEVECHKRLEKNRVDTGREFFLISVSDAESAVRAAHCEQIEAWISVFLPDHGAFRSDEVPDLSSLGYAAGELGISYAQVVDAVSGVTIDELMPSMRRMGFVDIQECEESSQ